MKKNYLFFMLLFPFLLVACDKEEEGPWIDTSPDTIAPVVSLTRPVMNDSVAIIYLIDIYAEMYDNRQLERVKVFLSGPSGENQEIRNVDVLDFFVVDKFTFSESYYIPKHTPPGMYTIRMEVSDKSGNVTQQSTRVKLVAHDLSFSAFEAPFNLSLFNSYLLQALDWFGYNHNDRGIAFDPGWLSKALFLMVSFDDQYEMSEIEWKRFIDSFGIKGQSWAVWDKDTNGNIDDDEFHAGITRIGLFEAWDMDSNKLIDHVELATGVFTSWDHNADKVLSKEEYLDNFYTYLYSKRE